jgi:hypothetical protein
MRSTDYSGVTIVLVVVVGGLLVWADATLIIDDWQRARRQRRRPDLTERVLPFQPMSLASEAQRWLEKQ